MAPLTPRTDARLLDVEPAPTVLHVVIPGNPVPGLRPRAKVTPRLPELQLLARARQARKLRDLLPLFTPGVYHPTSERMREWQRRASWELERARRAAEAVGWSIDPGEPISVRILCVFELPKGRRRVRMPPERSWAMAGAPGHQGDWDNLGKPVCDVASGILWPDDAQIVRAMVEKVVGAQDEPPRLEILVEKVTASAARTRFEARRDDAEQAGRLLAVTAEGPT